MTREKFQHVVEKTDSGGDFVLSTAFNGEGNSNFCFCGLAMQFGFPHARTPVGNSVRNLVRNPSCSTTSRRAVMTVRVCSSDPTVRRTQPSHPGSVWRSRTRIPRLRRDSTNSAWAEPIRTRTKLAWLGQ